LKSDTQTAYAVAIADGVLSGEAKRRAAPHLASAIERAGKHLTTGLVGTARLLPALSAIDRDDLAYALLVQESCPSWLCSIRNGATTLWERWDGVTDRGDFAEAGSNSLNQYAFGSVGEWMYDAIGGIRLDPAAPAGRHVFVRPRPGGGLTHARARYDSLYGTIETNWTSDKGEFRIKVTIPSGGAATVTLPFGGSATERKVPIDRASGVSVVEKGPSRTVVEVESGSYEFAVETP
jgi:alpha-L-rhamnosidase